MKTPILSSILFVLLLTGCKKETPAETTPTVTAPAAQETKSDAPKNECYIYDANGSVVSLQLSYNNDNVSGTLTYGLKEKDSNTGHFTGQIKNDILIAEYTFLSEGTESVRQVAFQFQNNKLVEGYGEMNEDGTHFKDVNQLKFDSKMPLNKTVCKE